MYISPDPKTKVNVEKAINAVNEEQAEVYQG